MKKNENFFLAPTNIFFPLNVDFGIEWKIENTFIRFVEKKKSMNWIHRQPFRNQFKSMAVRKTFSNRVESKFCSVFQRQKIKDWFHGRWTSTISQSMRFDFNWLIINKKIKKKIPSFVKQNHFSFFIFSPNFVQFISSTNVVQFITNNKNEIDKPSSRRSKHFLIINRRLDKVDHRFTRFQLFKPTLFISSSTIEPKSSFHLSMMCSL